MSVNQDACSPSGGLRPRTVMLVGVEESQRAALRHLLAATGHMVVLADRSDQVAELCRRVEPDLFIIGAGLSAEEGCNLSRSLRNASGGTDPAIMFCSNHATLADKLEAFAAGADDFVATPCYVPEVSLRISALLARVAKACGSTPNSPSGQTGNDLRLDTGTGELRDAGRLVQLTRVESRIVQYLFEAEGRTIPAYELARHVWGGSRGANKDALIRVHVCNLRTKLESSLPASMMIRSVKGFGYCLTQQT